MTGFAQAPGRPANPGAPTVVAEIRMIARRVLWRARSYGEQVLGRDVGHAPMRPILGARMQRVAGAAILRGDGLQPPPRTAQPIGGIAL
jgi:hypothetical protein